MSGHNERLLLQILLGNVDVGASWYTALSAEKWMRAAVAYYNRHRERAYNCLCDEIDPSDRPCMPCECADISGLDNLFTVMKIPAEEGGGYLAQFKEFGPGCRADGETVAEAVRGLGPALHDYTACWDEERATSVAFRDILARKLDCESDYTIILETVGDLMRDARWD